MVAFCCDRERGGGGIPTARGGCSAQVGVFQKLQGHIERGNSEPLTLEFTSICPCRSEPTARRWHSRAVQGHWAAEQDLEECFVLE